MASISSYFAEASFIRAWSASRRAGSFWRDRLNVLPDRQERVGGLFGVVQGGQPLPSDLSSPGVHLHHAEDGDGDHETQQAEDPSEPGQ
jgi:hypothetical protein